LLSLGGCAEAGAPSFDIFGAFFPTRLLCAVLGIFVALGARLFFAARNLVDWRIVSRSPLMRTARRISAKLSRRRSPARYWNALPDRATGQR